jgi:plasmid maintenance system antidote protein VapI
MEANVADLLPSEEPRRETNLGAMLRTFMAMERWTMRKLAPQIGISSATLHRACNGHSLDADTLLKIINWMVRARV